MAPQLPKRARVRCGFPGFGPPPLNFPPQAPCWAQTATGFPLPGLRSFHHVTGPTLSLILSPTKVFFPGSGHCVPTRVCAPVDAWHFGRVTQGHLSGLSPMFREFTPRRLGTPFVGPPGQGVGQHVFPRWATPVVRPTKSAPFVFSGPSQRRRALSVQAAC